MAHKLTMSLKLRSEGSYLLIQNGSLRLVHYKGAESFLNPLINSNGSKWMSDWVYTRGRQGSLGLYNALLFAKLLEPRNYWVAFPFPFT